MCLGLEALGDDNAHESEPSVCTVSCELYVYGQIVESGQRSISRTGMSSRRSFLLW